MAGLRTESLTDQVRNLLQGVIEDGKLVPGTRIHEENFAKQLGISKSPLRVALHQLKQDGLIRIEPRRGFYVAVPSVKQMLELLEMRAVLEGLATRLAAERSDEKLLRQLTKCFAGFEEADLDARRLEYAAADLRFQRLIVEASGSSELAKTLKLVNLRIHMSRLFANLSGHHDLAPYHREHLAMIEAIGRHESDRAESVAVSHVDRVRQLVLTLHGPERDDHEPLPMSSRAVSEANGHRLRL